MKPASARSPIPPLPYKNPMHLERPHLLVGHALQGNAADAHRCCHNVQRLERRYALVLPGDVAGHGDAEEEDVLVEGDECEVEDEEENGMDLGTDVGPPVCACV